MSQPLTEHELTEVKDRTLAHYNASAQAFWESTRDHDVTQNYDAFLSAIVAPAPLTLLDLGCGPGRDLRHFRALGHNVTGLDGCAAFAEMARRSTGCEVLEQSFLALTLPAVRFHGIFANASLFHVPTQELPRVLSELRDALVDGGVLFSSNPHGPDTEGFVGDRYGAFHTFESWRGHVTRAGFTEVEHYYRPTGKPRSEQPWLASVWRKATVG